MFFYYCTSKLPKTEISSGGMIHFWLKEGSVPWVNFLGETFLPLESIPFSDHRKSLDGQTQIKLPLCKPSDSDLLNILEIRKSDTTATYFVKIQRQRLCPE